jgi:dCTP deaminase
MILSGLEILKNLGAAIKIDPFVRERLNPNSYNLTLHSELGVYEDDVLDMKRKPVLRTFQIPEEGFVLQPGRLYLGRTAEYTVTDQFVPMLEGRSSIGRLGMFVHITAGFGDVGFAGFWTLEITSIQPIRIYAGVEICQIFYHQVLGDYEPYRSGKYQNNSGIQPSLLYKDFSQSAPEA